MNDSIAKCLIDLIEIITECSTSDCDEQLSHSHYITNQEADMDLLTIKERLQKLDD